MTDKEIKRCVICDRHSDHKNGRHLRYVYDKTSDDYHCNECELLVAMAVRRYDSFDTLLRPLPKGKDWLKAAEEFEKSLDLNWTEADILKILDEEIVE